jgi:hypothetical protein
MKSSTYKDKVIREIYYWENWPQNSVTRTKEKKSFYRDLDLKRLRTTDLGDQYFSL